MVLVSKAGRDGGERWLNDCVCMALGSIRWAVCNLKDMGRDERHGM